VEEAVLLNEGLRTLISEKFPLRDAPVKHSAQIDPISPSQMKTEKLSVLTRWLGVTAGVLVIILGVAVLLGWSFDGAGLRSAELSWTKMSPVTALTFVLCGTVLLLLAASVRRHPGASPQRLPTLAWHQLSKTLASVVMIIALLRLGDYLMGWNLGIDALPVSAKPGSAVMAPATAYTFLVVGCALYLATVPDSGGALQLLTMLAGLSGWLGLCRYVFGGQPIFPFVDMSIYTALGFVLMSVGILCARPDLGFMTLLLSHDIGGKITRRLLPPVLFVPMLIGWLQLAGQRAGWFNPAFGTALFAVTTILVFGALIWAIATLLQTADTQRRDADWMAWKSHQLMSSIIENSTTTIHVKDLAGRYLLVNRQFEELFRVNQEEALGKTDYDLFTQVQADAWHATDEQVAASGEVTQVEEALPRAEGVRSFISVKFPLRDALGRINAVGTISTEITERKRGEDLLRESEARFRTLADTAPVLIWMSGTDKLCNFFNAGWLNFTGRTLQQEWGDGWMESVHPDDVVRCRNIYASAFDARQPFLMEYRLRRRGGQYAWIIDSGVQRLAADGTFLGYIGSAMDITPQKQAEERFRLVVEASPSAMIMTDEFGVITLLNEKTTAVFGYAREELLGQSIERLIPERHRSVHSRHRQDYSRAPSVRAMGAGYDLHGRRKDGSEVPLEIGLTPIDTPQGPAVLAAIVDITARRIAEAEMAQQRNELTHLSRVTLLGELSGSLAHELNQPLTAILSNAQAALRFLAQDPSDIDEVRNILNDIADDDKRAGEIIQRLRTLFKKGEAPRRWLDVNEIVLVVLRLMRSDLTSRSVSVSTELAANLPGVEGDPVQLQQVLLNLIINGCDAMAGAPGDRQLALRTAATDDGTVVVSVTDRGAGVPPADLERIFEPFVTTKADGLGLGLAVCRTIVAAHGGRLWGTNNVDAAGATFHLALPVRPTDEQAGPRGHIGVNGIGRKSNGAPAPELRH
jgi:two-component system, LuxR family, sensor kinase FixL